VTKHRPCPIEFVGLKDCFGTSGEPDELAEHFQITAPYIAAAAKRAIERKDKLQ
jgi:transketolase